MSDFPSWWLSWSVPMWTSSRMPRQEALPPSRQPRSRCAGCAELGRGESTTYAIDGYQESVDRGEHPD
jgi:hypothetical protein